MKKCMKWFGTLAFMMMCAMTFTACGSDDDGGGGKTSGAYVGEWVNVNSYSDYYLVEVLKLNSNGTGTDTWYYLSEDESIYEDNNFTYSVSGNQITVKTVEGSVTGNYAMGTYDGSQFLSVTLNGSTTTYMKMTSEIRSTINSFNPKKGDLH